MNIEQGTSNIEVRYSSSDIQMRLVGAGENNGPNSRP